jgi:transposase-like protein
VAKFRKFFDILGWEAGTRTPVDRSRVLLNINHISNFNDLARQNTDNSGKIRNAAAMKIVQVLNSAKTTTWTVEQLSATRPIGRGSVQL